MLLTPHTLVGISVALAVQNPLIAVPVSFILHFVGDAVPHWDFYTRTTKEQKLTGWRPLGVMADFGFGIAVGLTATLYVLWVLGMPGLALTVFLSGIASVLPDVLTGPSIYVSNVGGFFKAIHTLQRRINNSASVFFGLLTQVIVTLLALFLILNSIK